MTLFRLRWVLLARWVRTVGWFLPVVVVFAAGCGGLFWLVAGRYPFMAALVALIVIVRLHLLRRDRRLLAQLLPHPGVQIAAEYLLLALLPGVLLLLQGAPFHALGLLAAAPACSLIPPYTPSGVPLRWLRTAWLAYSPEWTAGLRRHPVAAGALLLACLGCAALPWAGFPALCLAALFCSELYADNEPLPLLLLAERGSARTLVGKVTTAWRNYFLLAAPAAVLSLLLHPEGAWLAAVWLPYAALVLIYSVLAKYARYDPATVRPTLPGATLIGYLGFLVPFFLPVTLALIVAYALRAERNLNRYLYDYD